MAAESVRSNGEIRDLRFTCSRVGPIASRGIAFSLSCVVQKWASERLRCRGKLFSVLDMPYTVCSTTSTWSLASSGGSFQVPYGPRNQEARGVIGELRSMKQHSAQEPGLCHDDMGMQFCPDDRNIHTSIDPAAAPWPTGRAAARRGAVCHLQGAALSPRVDSWRACVV
jgi:hypothetical protein